MYMVMHGLHMHISSLRACIHAWTYKCLRNKVSVSVRARINIYIYMDMCLHKCMRICLHAYVFHFTVGPTGSVEPKIRILFWKLLLGA